MNTRQEESVNNSGFYAGPAEEHLQQGVADERWIHRGAGARMELVDVAA